jgi:glyoxalase family protein
MPGTKVSAAPLARGDRGANSGSSAKLELVSLLGFHHITALAGDAQQNLDFYTQQLGLRLVKRTVNYDDPATYHFYFGDDAGSPGSLLTFFPWPAAPAGRMGSGVAECVRFETPHADRFRGYAEDPAGLRIALDAGAKPRIESVMLRVEDADRSARFLTEKLGFTEAGPNRFALADAMVEIEPAPGVERAKLSAGMIHHVAFRVAGEAEQLEFRAKLKDAGVRVTRVIDRQYFKSIYFREPGGVLFEIATDGPGFLIDEAADALGAELKLPPWLEPIRESVVKRLPEVQCGRT